MLAHWRCHGTADSQVQHNAWLRQEVHHKMQAVHDSCQVQPVVFWDHPLPWLHCGSLRAIMAVVSVYRCEECMAQAVPAGHAPFRAERSFNFLQSASYSVDTEAGATTAAILTVDLPGQTARPTERLARAAGDSLVSMASSSAEF
jgi:predicted GTPase